jgi:ketosteroid isomerase-like protein
MKEKSRFNTSGKGTDMSGTGASETQNIAAIRRGYEAFAKGDIETLKTLFAPNAIWHSVATGVLPGNYRGAQAIMEFFGRLAQETNGTVRAELQTIAASGDHVFALHRNTGKRKGKTVDTKSVLVFKLDKGVVTEVAEFRFDHPAEVHFWS